MKVIDEGHTYETLDGQTIQFIKRTAGELVTQGTTNEELIEILLDRTTTLDDKFPCDENKIAIIYLTQALQAFHSRTNKRVAQGVETKDLPHVS